jgi:hypothetical protein
MGIAINQKISGVSCIQNTAIRKASKSVRKPELFALWRNVCERDFGGVVGTSLPGEAFRKK